LGLRIVRSWAWYLKLEALTGISVSDSTVCHELERMKHTRKDRA
jgi:hypothetical protein